MKIMMMTSILLMITSLSFADVNVSVKNLSLNYQDPKGSGSTKGLNFDGVDHVGPFQIEKVADIVYFNFAGNRVEWVDLQAVLKDASLATINNLNLTLNNSGINTQASLLNLAIGDSRTIVSNLSGNCNGAKPQQDFVKSLLGHCSKNGKLKFSSFEMQDFHKSLYHSSAFSSLIMAILQQVGNEQLQVKGGAPKMSNLDLSVSNNNFSGSVEVAMGISAKVDFSGRFDLIDNDTKLRIKLDKANVWIVSVADQVFNELGKIKGLDVKRPYITIKL